MPLPKKRERRHPLQPLPGLKENPNSLHFILLAVQSMLGMQECSQVQVLTNILEELEIVQVHPIAFAASSDPDTFLPAIWSMRRKLPIDTRAIYKFLYSQHPGQSSNLISSQIQK
jgi:hypothetical protein